MDRAESHVIANIAYVASVSEDEKAYQIMYGESERDELPRTNMKLQWLPTRFNDLRMREDELSFAKTGVAVRKLNSAMQYTDFEDEGMVTTVYFEELAENLREFLGAQEVKFFRYGIRKRHQMFPASTGQQYDFAQPTSIAHVDATLLSTEAEMVKQFGDRADESRQRRFQWVNVWKPLRGPVNDWPLCFCDASSVHSEDLEVTDMVYEDYHTENISLRHNAAQRWYFLSDHRADEIIIFKQSDSDPGGVPGVPHCSFDNPGTHRGERPRESIEARALVLY